MPRVIRSARAKVELWEVADRIARHNPGAAVRFLERVDEAVRHIATFPGIGPERDELRAGWRSFPVGNYIVFYKISPDYVEILRVTDGRRDLDDAIG